MSVHLNIPARQMRATKHAGLGYAGPRPGSEHAMITKVLTAMLVIHMLGEIIVYVQSDVH